MPLTAPLLDDRKFQDIVNEARTLIPRFTSEWTDFNESDPGMTLIELFAWMTELLIYRLNQVPELNYVKFLQLLGIELTPARPALADLTFTADPNRKNPAAVAARTRVSGPGSPPAIFETDEGLWAIGALLTDVVVFDSFSSAVFSNSNSAIPPGPAKPYFPFGPHARPGAALLLGFQSPIGLPDPGRLFDLMVYVYTTATSQIGRDCELDLTRIAPPAEVAWEYFDGADWWPLMVDTDQTRALTRSGHVRLALPPAPAIAAVPLPPIPDPRYWVRCRLVSSQYERPPQLQQVVTNTVSATQALTIEDEVLGGSSGDPNQAFKLASSPVLVLDVPEAGTGPDGLPVQILSVRLEVDEGDGFLPWQEVNDFFNSQRDSPHFTVDHTTGDIRFGDNRRGRIPLPNQARPSSNIVARRYRTGGGTAGNAVAGAIASLQGSIDGVQSVKNYRPAQGGADEETVDDAKLRAPAELKSKDRAVTVEDFEALARATPSAQVRRAKALPLYDPRYPGVAVPGAVTVVVIPESDQPDPFPNEETLATVCQYLNQRRLLTTEIHVVPPRYQKVQVTVQVMAEPDADVTVVTRLVRQAIAAYLNPVVGGESGTGWDFGGTIYYSQVFRRIVDVPGVDRIENNQLVISLDGVPQPICSDTPIAPHALVYTIDAENQVTVDYGWRPPQ